MNFRIRLGSNAGAERFVVNRHACGSRIAGHGSRRMLRVARSTMVACLLATLSTSCLWRSYADILSVHLDVVTQTASKLCSVIEAGRGPSAEAMAEYVYPAQRAREFLRQYGGYSDRASYRKLGALLDRYEGMVRRVDAARAGGSDAKLDQAALNGECDALKALAEEARGEARAGR
ncbi:MAG: hypothetical protein HY270_06490 [Deltaproteobacteria bacterium]|nr:hypothetical protein [Deltaproteobacteria bacterium]